MKYFFYTYFLLFSFVAKAQEGYPTPPKSENRLFFVDERYEQGFPLDENESFYIGKSIAGLKLNQSAQNPITYLYPLEKDKIYI